MADKQKLEEAAAALVATVDDRSLRKAAAGDFGDELRLLALGEKVRRDMRKRSAA